MELIKYRWNNLLNRIYELVRQIWKEKRIPKKWKETIIVPIYKKGERDRCENYRGIALGIAAYKILVNTNLKKIKPHIEKINGEYQNGIRDGRSVTDNKRGVVKSSRTEFFALVRSVVTTPAPRGIIPKVSWASVLKASFLCASCVTQL